MSRTQVLATERKAVTADIPAVVQLVNSAYRGEDAKKGWTTEADILGGQRIDAEKVAEILKNDHQTILVWPTPEKQAQLDCCVLLETKVGAEVPMGYLGMLTVRPELQNAGFGRQMLAAAERFFRMQNIDRIEMTVIRGRTELIEWYQRRGYELTGESRPFQMNDPRFGIPKVSHLEFVVLEKRLSKD